MRILCRALVVFSLIMSVACASVAQSDPHPASLSIKGHVEHTERLPPFTEFRVGEKYDGKKILADQRARIGYWWKVPKWFEGTWAQSGKIHVLSLKDLGTDKAMETKRTKDIVYERKETVGFQKDQAGDTWTCVPVPYVRKDSTGGFTNINIVTGAHAKEITNDSVSLVLTATTITVKSATNKIVQISQRESVQTYKPVNSSTIEVVASMKFYDGDGNGIYTEELRSRKRRTAGYVQVDELSVDSNGSDGINLPMSFAAFLIQHDLRTLLPDRLIPERLRSSFKEQSHSADSR